MNTNTHILKSGDPTEALARLLDLTPDQVRAGVGVTGVSEGETG